MANNILSPGRTSVRRPWYLQLVVNSFRGVVLCAVLLYLLLLPVWSMPIYNMILFHPFKDGFFNATGVGPYPIEKAYFPSRNGTKLNCWYIKRDGARDTVLISHGNAGNLTHRSLLMKNLLDLGVSVFIYDYAGYGQSEGSPSLPGVVDDGIGAFDYLVNTLKIAPEHIIIMGESIGTGVSCQVSVARKCKALILQSAFTNLRDVGRSKIWWLKLYPDALFPSQMLDSAQVLNKEHAPLLILHGQQDQIIPIDNCRSLFAQATESKRMVEMPNCGHNDMGGNDADAYTNALKSFLKSI